MLTLKNKILIVLTIVLALSFMAIYGLFRLYSFEKSERERFNNNYVSVLTDNARQQELTVKELKSLYPKYDSLASELKIKTKFITNIIDTRYNFRDTLLTSSILKKDSVSEKSFFNLTEKCYSLSGYIKKDSITFNKKEFKDNLTTFIYKDYEHKYIWGLIKTGPFFSAKVYSECMKDTVGVTNNIKIKK